MPNTLDTAAKWTEFLAARQEFPIGNRLLQAFREGAITRLCGCGCNAYDLKVPEESSIKPIAKPGGYGSVFEISFEAHGSGPPEGLGSLELIVFADEFGHLAGIEVDFCGNSYPVPESVTISEFPYHVHRSAAIDA